MPDAYLFPRTQPVSASSIFSGCESALISQTQSHFGDKFTGSSVLFFGWLIRSPVRFMYLALGLQLLVCPQPALAGLLYFLLELLVAGSWSCAWLAASACKRRWSLSNRRWRFRIRSTRSTLMNPLRCLPSSR